MKKLLYIVLLGITFTALSCGGGDDIEAIEQRAGLTAQEYYKLLLDGKYDDFVAGMDGCDSLPNAYHEQMVANTAMFVEQQKEDHKGISDITLSRCHADTASHTAEAMLTLEYADNVKEIVCVPMVERNGNWYMR